MHRSVRVTVTLAALLLLAAYCHAQSAELRISGDVATPLTLTAADLKRMPRKTLSVMNPHEKKNETYEGVLLQDILAKAGTPQGENLRGKAMGTYVVAEADDGYRVVFSLAELEPGIGNAEVLVADTMDGEPLGAKLGPLRLVAPHDKRPARWVRMLKSITIVRASARISSLTTECSGVRSPRPFRA